MKEWRDIPGYEGRYRISTDGEVYSVPREVRFGHARRTVGGKILKQQHDINGYLTVCMCDGNGDRRPKKVHRLLASAFIPNQDNLPCINHKDENKENNHISNLEWCTVEYNNNYGTHQQRSSRTRFKNQKCSHPVICIETEVIYPSMREAARQTGIDQSQMWHCVKEPWRVAKGFHWCLYGGEIHA